MTLPKPHLFWAKVQKTSGGCWLWTGYRNKLGYGVVGVAGRKTALAHRVAFAFRHGVGPEPQNVCHHCDNPPCVNPSHLFLESDRDNMRDAVGKGRRASFKGTRNGRAKLTGERVREIRALYIPGKVRMADLAAKFGISGSQVQNIISGREWREQPS